MHAVIFAAGQSTRTRPITLTRPKPLLPFFESTILEQTLDGLVGTFSEVIVVVGFCKEQIQEKIGNEYKGMRIRYVVQEKILGTGGLLTFLRASFEPPFLVLNGDDYYSRSDIEALSKLERAALLSSSTTQSRSLDGWRVDGNHIVSLGKKDPKFGFGVATGGYVISEDYFSLPPVKLVGREEVGLPQTLEHGVKKNPYSAVFTQDTWLPVGYPWDLLSLHDVFWKERKEKMLLGKNVDIHPEAEIGERVILQDGVKVGKGAKISHSIVFAGTVIGEGTDIAHSILGANNRIGKNVSIQSHNGAGNWHVTVKDEDVDTGETDLGIFTADACVIPDGTVMLGATLLNNKSNSEL